jgi:hypothetical protein
MERTKINIAKLKSQPTSKELYEKMMKEEASKKTKTYVRKQKKLKNAGKIKSIETFENGKNVLGETRRIIKGRVCIYNKLSDKWIPIN